MTHLDADAKRIGQRTHQFSEIHPVLSGVVERRLFAVALKLHVGQLHVEPEAFDDVPSFTDGIRLPHARLLPRIDVLLRGFAFDALDFVVVFGSLRVHLGADEFSGEAHDTHILSVVCVEYDNIADVHVHFGRFAKEPFAVRFESNLHHIKRALARWQGHPFQPIKHGE